MSMARTVSTTLVMIAMSYTAIPHIVSAMADNSKLQHQLQRQSVELSEARSELNQLRYRAMQPGGMELSEAKAELNQLRYRHMHPGMLAEDEAPRVGEFYRQRRAVAYDNRSAAPAVATAPLPDTITAAAAAFASPQCRDKWLARRRREAGGPPPAHPEPLPFAGGNLAEPGVLEAALQARAPAKELIFLSVGDTRDHRREIKDPVPAPSSGPELRPSRLGTSPSPPPQGLQLPTRATP